MNKQHDAFLNACIGLGVQASIAEAPSADEGLGPSALSDHIIDQISQHYELWFDGAESTDD